MRNILASFVFISSLVLSSAPLFSAESTQRIWMFGVEIEELARQSQTHKRRVIRGELATVNFEFDEDPFAIAAFTADGVFDADWFAFMPGSTATLQVPPGEYEFMVLWTDPMYIYKVAVLEGTRVFPGEQLIYVNESDAMHTLDIDAYNQSGNLIQVESAYKAVTLRRQGCDSSPFHVEQVTVGFAARVIKISSLSDAYSVDSHVYAKKAVNFRNHPVYSFNASFQGGIQGDRVVELSGNDWLEVIIRQHPEPWRERLLLVESITNHPFANLPDSELGFAISSMCSNTSWDEPFVSPFEQTYYLHPGNNPRGTLGFFKLGARRGDDCQNPGAYLYRSPIFGLSDGFGGFVHGSATPIYRPHPDSKVYPVGIGPYYWFAKAVYSPEEVKLLPSMGIHLVAFQGQTGTRFSNAWPQALLFFDLYKGDSLVETGFRYYVEAEGEFAIPLEQPGEHTLVATQSQYYMGNINGKTVATVRFGVNETDPNPPYMTQLHVMYQEEPVDTLYAGTTIEMKAFDDETGIASLRAWYESFVGPKEVTVACDGDNSYTVGPINIDDAGSTTVLTVRIEDAAGNFLEQEIRFPVEVTVSPTEQPGHEN